MLGARKYLILGAGTQGVAAAFDVIRHGRASRVALADRSPAAIQAAARRLRSVAGAAIRNDKIRLDVIPLDVRDKRALLNALQDRHAVLSALPYYFNPAIARAAIEAGTHYCDLGGYFESTRSILRLDHQARKAGVTLIPDCGVAPGLCNSLAVCGMERLDKARDVHVYCGGLPQEPRPPLDYMLLFNLEGVLGNYFGRSYVLRNGKVTVVPTFSGREVIDFGKPLGRLEAVITGGATSTCPWTFRNTLKNYDYKTLRYPGHFEKIMMLKELGLLETSVMRVNGFRFAPRDVFVAVAGPRLSFPEDRDLLIMRVVVSGTLGGKNAEARYQILDYGDSKTGFTAMQRATGFSAAFILEMLARGLVTRRGVVPVERAVPGWFVLDEMRKRGIKIRERLFFVTSPSRGEVEAERRPGTRHTPGGPAGGLAGSRG